ncbi:MAG: CBS domain-containing protein [Pseudonocardiaceae bacterium]
MQPLPPALARDVPLNAVIDRFAVEGRDALPVIDEQGAYRGAVTIRDVEDSVRENALEATAGTLARAVPTLDPGQTLEQALAVLVQQDRSGLPVVTPDNGEILGWLTHRDVLAAYNTRLQRGVQQAQTAAGAAVLARPPAAPSSPPTGGSPCPDPPAGLSPRRPGTHRRQPPSGATGRAGALAPVVAADRYPPRRCSIHRDRRHPTRTGEPTDPAHPRRTRRPDHRIPPAPPPAADRQLIEAMTHAPRTVWKEVRSRHVVDQW